MIQASFRLVHARYGQVGLFERCLLDARWMYLKVDVETVEDGTYCHVHM